jgi:hypothetical protein
VLLDLLTGLQAFAADNITDIMAAVVKTDPDWNALPPDMPRVREVLRRCLEKDPKQRLRDIGDARRDLEPATYGLAAGSVPAAAVRMRSAVAFCVVAAALGVIAGAGWWKASAPGEGPANPISRFAIALPADAAINFKGPVASLAISQDGRTIVYAGAPLSEQASVPVLGSSFTGASMQPGRARLYARRLDDLIVRPISGTDNARQPFFSPDGQWIAFFVDEQLKKLPLGGGMATTIANVTGNASDGAWCDDDTILLGGYSIARVSAGGGPVQRAVTLEPGERATRPQLLADGSILFTIAPNSVTTFDEAKIAVSTPGGTRRILIEGGAFGQYVPSGHLVYMRGGSIMAARMTLSPLEVIGQPVAVQTGGMFNWASADAAVALSQTGTLVYVPGGP